MSVVVGIVIRLLGLFGVSLSPFAAGAVMAGALALAVAAATAGAGLHLYNAGWRSADAAWQAKALQSQIDALKADRDLAARALADERLRVAGIEQQSRADQEGTAQYVDELKKTYAAACALDDADLRFLRERARRGRARPRAAGASGGLAKSRPGAAAQQGR